MTPAEIWILVVGIVAATVAIIMLILLAIMFFRHRYVDAELILKTVKANINKIRLFFQGAMWQIRFLAARKNVIPSQPPLPQLPASIKVVRQNTTRPLAMYHLPCPSCGRTVRMSAAFCPNCGISLDSPRAMPKPTIDLQPLVLGPVSDNLPVVPVNGELDEESPEIVHIDLMLKVKLYLLWDKAGR